MREPEEICVRIRQRSNGDGCDIGKRDGSMALGRKLLSYLYVIELVLRRSKESELREGEDINAVPLVLVE